MSLPPPDPTPKKTKKPPRPAYHKFVQKNNGKIPVGPTETMPGPNVPDPKYKKVPGVLGPKAAKNGAYFVPGLGEWAKQRNAKRNRKANTNPFNTGRPDSDRYS